MSSKQGAQARGPGPVAQLLRPIRSHLMAAAGLSALGAMLALAPLAAIAEIAVQALSGNLAPDTHSRTLAISLACLFAGLALIGLGELAAHLADNRMTRQLRLQITHKLTQVPLGWFASRASGEVRQAMQDDIATLHSLSAHYYTSSARAYGAIAASVLYLFAMDWRMALVSLLPFPAFFLFFRHALRAAGANMQDFASGVGRINNAVEEFVSGLPVLKAFGAGGRAHGSYRVAVDDFAMAFARFTRPLVGSMANAHAMVAPVAVLGVVLLAGSVLVATGVLAPPALLPFALVAPGICAPVLLLHYLTHELQNAAGAAARVQALLATPVLAQPPAGQGKLPQGSAVRFENLGFSHDGLHPVLADISFAMQPGTVTAIVGASGSGKSTLARLLLRFFDPDQGRITVGGVDLREMETRELYRHIGFVLQDVRLIHASVRDNIALGRPGASLAQVEQAARAAQIHERILALPRGYDAVIGEDARLSGGEQQRISIARALLLDAPVLVLDEPTAAVDAESENSIGQALSRFAQGRTLLVIAHRLDTIMHAQQIIVLDQGRICEQGSHAALLALGGKYARLWALGGYGAARGVAA